MMSMFFCMSLQAGDELQELDDAIDESDVFRIPTQIFADDCRIPYDHVLAIPESIF